MSARPPAWRTALFLVLMLAVLATAGYMGWHRLTAPISTQPTCIPQTVSGPLTTADVAVRVYNVGSKKGLAASIQQQLQTAGFTVPYVGNSTEQVTQTTVIGGTADAPEVQLVAGFFPGATVQGDNRADQSVDVLVGGASVDFNANAPTQVTSDTATGDC